MNNASKIAFILLLIVLTVAVCPMGLQAMPGSMHHRGAERLMETPVEKGGFENASPEYVRKVMDFMDGPARKIGEYHVKVSGGKLLTPSNHADLFHNPANVGNVFHSKVAENIARLHKIQDIAYNAVNEVSVDGWTITAKMQKQAQDILRHVARTGAMPKHLPRWVDNKGTNITKTAVKHEVENLSIAGSAMKKPVITRIPGPQRMTANLNQIAQNAKGIEKPTVVYGIMTAQKIIVPLKSGLLTFAVDAGIATYSYLAGETWLADFQREVQYAAIRGTTVGTAIAVAIVLGATPGGWAVLAVGLGAYIITDLAIQIWKHYEAKQYLAMEDLSPFGISPSDSILASGESLLSHPGVSLENEILSQSILEPW